jgi:xanthine/uracil permease
VRDWWTILHPPYTAWHLAYVAIGASLAPHVDGVRLTATLLAFFCAVGVSAHTLDEVHGHPLQTRISDIALWTVASAGLLAAVALGIAGVSRVGPGLLVFIAIGAALLVAYNLEWFDGRLHTDIVFAAAWGSFPVVTSYYAQAERVNGVAIVAAIAAFFLSWAQRSLSSKARELRRRVVRIDGTMTRVDGTVSALDVATLLRPLEVALHALAWGMVALAVAMTLFRFS